MGIITKNYTTRIVDSAVIEVSNIHEAFDTIYDTVNGGINSANLASTFSIDASNVSINDSNSYFTATKVSVITQEAAQKGWNSIHVSCFGSEGFKIHPGIIEINQKYCRVRSPITTTSGSLYNVTSTALVWYLAIRDTPIVTATDILLVEYTSSNTITYDAAKVGYYYTYNSASFRAIGTIRHKRGLGILQSISYDDELLQRPQIGHKYVMSSAEASALGFNWSGMFQSGTVMKYYDINTSRYAYRYNSLVTYAGGANTCATFLNAVDWNFSLLTTDITPCNTLMYTYELCNLFYKDNNYDAQIAGGAGPVTLNSLTTVGVGSFFDVFLRSNTGMVIGLDPGGAGISGTVNFDLKRRVDVMRRNKI
jgi:hypothetical protein